MNGWAAAIASNVIWPVIALLVNWRKDAATVDKAKADAAAVIQETSAELVQQVRSELVAVRVRLTALEDREAILIGWIRLLHRGIADGSIPPLPSDVPEDVSRALGL